MSDSEQTQQGESYPQPNPAEERTVENRVVTSHYDPALASDPQRTQPNLPKAPSAPLPQAQTAITPVVRNTPPQGYTPPQPTPAPRPPRRGRKRSRGCMPGPSCFFGCMGFIGVLAVAGLILILIGYTMLSQRLESNIQELEASLIAIDDPTSSSGFESTFIYDRNGAQLWEIFGQGRRQRIPLSDIPESVRQATVSVEDNDFYTHPGFDLRSNFRALGQYIENRRVVSGASTITQQLVRNVVFEPEYRREISVQRKLEEILLATVMTQRMTKDEVLELYLNAIYYGNLSYGIEAASQTYFGKSAIELELHEAALLAGLPQLPAIIDPLNPDPAIQAQVLARQGLVLDLMAKEGYISTTEAEAAKSRSLNFVRPDVPLEAPHFTLYALSELERLIAALNLPSGLVNEGGLRVYTTVDLEFQAVAQRAAERNVNALRDRHNLTNSAVVVIHPPSGEILAMVGSVDYENEAIDGQVNVAIAQRQPGSTMKTFTYAAAMEQGWTAGTILWDVETNFGLQGSSEYVPANYDRRFHGPVRLRDALANSYNIPAVLANEYIGVDYLIAYMRRLGTRSLVEEPGRYGLSLTLGGGEITLLELTSNYATFAREGIYTPSTSILCVLDKNNRIIYEYENRCPQGDRTASTRSVSVQRTPVIDPRIAFVISDILSDNAARTPAMGANSPLNTGSLLTAVKTGTTDNFRDNWTVGYTRDLAVGVWSGNSNNDAMRDVSGLVGAAPIWNETITEIYRRFEMPPSVWLQPSGVSQRPICNIRGVSDPLTDCRSYNEWFLDDGPLLPDGQGGLARLNNAPPQAPQPPPEFGPQLIEREAGIWEVDVRPLIGIQTDILAAQNPSLHVAPRYCMVPVEVLGSVFDARRQLFIAPPANPNRQRNAYRYAANANLPILPQIPCTGETLNILAPIAPGVSGQILYPQSGQTVSGVIDILGVAEYPPDGQFEYYKLEVRGGPFPDWTTLGDLHYNQVREPARLETFYAEALPPGVYELRLWLQGNLPVSPSSVTINLVSP